MPRRNYSRRRGRYRPHTYDGPALERLLAELTGKRPPRNERNTDGPPH